MGFTRHAGPMARGGIPGFEPKYQRHRSWAARYGNRTAPTCSPTWDAASRADAAAMNRAMCWRPCRLMIRDGAAPLSVYVDEVTGEWQDISGGAFGASLIDLASLAWALPYGKAGFRLSRAVGMEAIPNAA